MKSLWKKGLFFLSLAGCCLACDRSPPYVSTKIEGFAQGGDYRVVIRDTVPRDLSGPIDSLFREIEASLSLYDPDSRISRINRNETDTVDRYLADCIRRAQAVSRETEGVYDITVKPLIAAYGFAEKEAQRRPNVDSLLQFVGYEKIRLEGNRIIKEHPGVQLDLNSIAQGYSADVVARYLDSLGLKNYLVVLGGGEIFARGANASGEKWVIGIDRPVEGNVLGGVDLQERVGLSERGLATSGNYRKYYTDESGRKIVHTVDPRTGQPVVSNLLSATVIAPNAATADAYGTYFMVAGLEGSKAFLERHPELDAYLVWTDEKGDYRVFATPGIEIKKQGKP